MKMLCWRCIVVYFQFGLTHCISYVIYFNFMNTHLQQRFCYTIKIFYTSSFPWKSRRLENKHACLPQAALLCVRKGYAPLLCLHSLAKYFVHTVIYTSKWTCLLANTMLIFELTQLSYLFTHGWPSRQGETDQTQGCSMFAFHSSSILKHWWATSRNTVNHFTKNQLVCWNYYSKCNKKQKVQGARFIGV